MGGGLAPGAASGRGAGQLGAAPDARARKASNRAADSASKRAISRAQ
jgi:hypothetical protein